MATNPLPKDTVNFPVNMPVTMRAEIGRLSAMEGQSLGAYIRGLLESRIADAYRRGRLVDRCQQAMRLGLAIFAAVSLALVGQDKHKARRPRRGREEVACVA